MTRALILGVGGQDGSYLAEQLLEDGYEVFGMARRVTEPAPGVHILMGDLLDLHSLVRVLRDSQPDEVYNLAAVTSPGGSWGTVQPPLLTDVTALGPVRLVDAMLRVVPFARLVHASSSAIFDPHRYGLYGISKLFAHEAMVGYRDRIHVSNAILYSHTSPRQDPRFLAPTICSTLARVAKGADEKLVLTDVIGARDWGYAPDFMRALPLIAHQDEADDWVVATQKQHSVRDFVSIAVRVAGLEWDRAIRLELGPPAPHEVLADTAPLRALGWKPQTSFTEMVESMMAAALADA